MYLVNILEFINSSIPFMSFFDYFHQEEEENIMGALRELDTNMPAFKYWL
jgi:hypothetical protein